ncbi:hypothetical protein Tco_0498860 [Tanacetum coccineum]
MYYCFPKFEALSALQLKVSDLEKEVKELRNVDHSTALLATIKSEVPTAVKEYRRTNLGDTLHKVLQRHTVELIQEQSVLAYVIEVLKQQQKLQKFDQKQAMFETMTESKSFNKHPTHMTLYHALMESILTEEDDMDQGVADLDKQKKRKHADCDRDEDPPAVSDQWLKKRKTSKDAEPPKRPKLIGSSKDTIRSQPKSTGKSIQLEETVFVAVDIKMSLNQGNHMGDADEQPNVEAAPNQDWFKKLARPLTHDLEWNKGKSVDNEPIQTWLNDLANAKKPPLTFDDLMSTHIDFYAFVMNRLQISELTKANLNNPEGNRCPYDLSKPLPLHESRGRLTIPADFFFNNDLEYLRGGSTDKKYTESTTKTKATKYEIEGIEYMVSRHDVYSTMRIPSVTSVTVDEWYGYGHLKEIVVRREDEKLYKFMEGDFPRLHLNDIEDMLLLLGVESYQKKLNISKPRTRDVDLSQRAPYTTLSEPQGVIYEDRLKRNRLMRTEELYKFSDGTLTSVRNTLDQMLKNLRIMRSLEKFVGGRDYGTDYRLLQRTLKNFKKDDYTSFQDKEKYEHVGQKATRSQKGKRSQDDDKRLDSANDLKEAQDHIQVKIKEQAHA